ncbi:MAG: rRNA maturation RNase YbeY [Planctomycetes bacterium]|nr:rRNA maturation RNase YbeY [Planctomycetota bacterium]
MNDDTPYDIEINNPHTYDWVDEVMLRNGISEALRRFEVTGAEISIAVVSDDEIAALHQEYLNISGPTDVLTFDLSTAPSDPQAPRRIDGEVVLSAETAMHCASRNKHLPAAELALYAVHGVLHLLGMNDKNEREAAEMHRTEDEILMAIGVGRVFGESSSCA